MPTILPPAAIAPFLGAVAAEVGPNGQLKGVLAAGVLADYLTDHDDVRAAVLRRAIGHEPSPADRATLPAQRRRPAVVPLGAGHELLVGTGSRVEGDGWLATVTWRVRLPTGALASATACVTPAELAEIGEIG